MSVVPISCQSSADCVSVPPQDSAPPAEHPKLAAILAQLRERQEAQQAHEQRVKTDLVKQAAGFLEEFYQVQCRPSYSQPELFICSGAANCGFALIACHP